MFIGAKITNYFGLSLSINIINTRNIWLIAGIIIGLFALPVKVVREYYQYKHYHLSRFEWEDVVRYSLVIAIGSVIHFLLW